MELRGNTDFAWRWMDGLDLDIPSGVRFLVHGVGLICCIITYHLV